MKSAFPQWLREALPLLKAEDTNGVFEAFHNRRIERAKRGLLPFRIPFDTVGFIALVAAIVIAYTAIRLVPSRAGLRLFMVTGILLGIVAVLRHFLPRRRVYSAAAVFTITAARPLEATDLWLCGVHGREVLEAIFLEEVQQRWLWLVALSGVPAVAGIVMVYLYGHPLTAVGLLLQASLVFFGIQCVRSGIVGVGSYAMEKHLLPRVRMWSGGRLGRRLAAAYRAQFLSAVVVVILIFAFVFLVALCVGPLQEIGRGISNPFVKRHAIEGVAILITFSSALILRLLRKNQLVNTTQKFNALLEDADNHFENHIRREVLHDPDVAPGG